MKIFNLLIIDVEKRVKEIYYSKFTNDDRNEITYAAYRTITGASIQESHQIVKAWVKKWGGKNES